jgi:tetratricopeptide (TPR) repeat protein
VKRGILAAIVLAVIAAAGYGYVVTEREGRHRELIDRGDAALGVGDLSTAIETFSVAVDLRPDSMIGYLKRGDAYRRRGDVDAALRDLRTATELDPSAPMPRELLGDVNYSRERFAPAAQHYQAYVDLDDSQPRILYKLALAQYRAGQPGPGIRSLEKAIALDGNMAAAHFLLALCHRSAGDTEAALAALRRAIAVAPTMLEAREELADLFAHLGRSQEGLEQLEALRALDPAPARDVTLGLALARAGQPERAIMTLRHAAERHPNYTYTFVALGRVWLDGAQARGDQVELNKAMQALERALTDNSSEAYALYGRALLAADDPERAERILLQATDKMPADPLAFYYLGDAAARLGHADAARQAFVDYLALAGDDLDARRHGGVCVRVGELSLQMADIPAAVSYLERAAPVLGATADFTVTYAEARWRAGEIDAAREMLDGLLEKEPSHAAARALRRRMR